MLDPGVHTPPPPAPPPPVPPPEPLVLLLLLCVPELVLPENRIASGTQDAARAAARLPTESAPILILSISFPSSPARRGRFSCGPRRPQGGGVQPVPWYTCHS